MNLTTDGANSLLNSEALPATLWVQLHTDNPTDAGTANVATLSTRKAFALGTPGFGAASNDALIQWISAPADETLTHISVWSASTGGACWFVGAMTASADAVTGQNVEIQIGSLDVSLDTWA
mgnify:CR=1 FL=1